MPKCDSTMEVLHEPALVRICCLHSDVQSASIWRLASQAGVTNERRQLLATAKLVCDSSSQEVLVGRTRTTVSLDLTGDK